MPKVMGTYRWRALLNVAFVGLVAGAAATACGGPPEPAVTPVNPAVAIDADPLALLPAAPAILGNVDARAFYASGSTGAQVAALAEGLFPFGQEVGFSAGRDVDRMAVAVYAGATLDAVGVLQGRFDVPRITAAGAAHIPTRTGAPLVALPYAGRTLYTVSNFAFSPLTDHTMVAGSESAVRRVLDRLAMTPAAPAREVADWMLGAVQTPGSSYALVADVASIPPAALRGIPLPPGMTGLLRAAVIGDFHPPGLNVAGTLTYADPTRAAAGADTLRQVAAFANIAASLGAGPKIQNLTITPNGPSVGCNFALDDEAMKRSLASIMKVVGGAVAPASMPPPHG